MRDLDLGTGVLVALHGHDDEPASARAWGRELAPAGWEVVAPGAPRDGEGRRSWFAQSPRGADGGSLDAAVGRVLDVVGRIAAAGRPVVLVGFSQGGAVVLELASRGATGMAAMVAISGYLPEVDRATGEPGEAADATTPLLVIGGDADDVVPEFMGRDAAALLASAGVPTTSVTVAADHGVGRATADAAHRWLADTLRRGPKVSLGLPVERVETGAELVSAAGISELASAWERLGFHAAYVTDHPAPDDRWLAAGGHHALEPTVALGLAAGATRRLLVHTNVYVLPYRNPFLAAKALASLDLVSGGRLIAGVAAGYLRPEFAALGRDHARRAELMDEALELLPRIWAGSTVQGEGTDWAARGVTALPRPLQRPRPPIWVGGNSPAAMRRAVRHGDGWSPFPTPEGVAAALGTSAITDRATLRAAVGRLGEMAAHHGRSEPLTVCFVPFSLPRYLADPGSHLEELVDEVHELFDLGVGWSALMVPGGTRGEVVERASELAVALGLG